MIEWWEKFANWFPLTWSNVFVGVLLFAVTFIVSLAVVSFLLVKIPPDYFQASYPREFWLDRHPLIRWGGLVVKNLIGVVLVVLGILMSLPGVPGQGVLTILLGVMLLDFPGKRRLELNIVSRPRVWAAINQLREKFGKPPLALS